MIPPPGDKHDRQTRQTFLDRLGHIPPRHPWHTQISEKQVEPVSLQQSDALLSICRHHGLVTEGLQEGGQGLPGKRLVVDNQDFRAGLYTRRRCLRCDDLGNLYSNRQGHRDGCTTPLFTGHQNLSVVAADDSMDHAETESGPPYPFRRKEWIEDTRLDAVRNPNPGIRHREQDDPSRLAPASLAPLASRDRSFRPLSGIRTP